MLFQLLLYCCYSFSVPTHDIRLSLCTIELNSADSTAFVNFRLFTDDLAVAIQKPLLANPKDKQYDADVVDYLIQHCKISKGEQQKEFFFFSRTANEEVFEVSFLLTSIYEFKNIEIYNSILLEQFGNQRNIIKLIHKEGKKQYILDTSNRVLSL
ncbi:MAG: DUF6702 family protein [Bacteroidota bacterium]